MLILPIKQALIYTWYLNLSQYLQWLSHYYNISPLSLLGQILLNRTFSEASLPMIVVRSHMWLWTLHGLTGLRKGIFCLSNAL